MIPILYKKGTTDFDNNGVGALTEATKCVVTEERNGSYEVELQYPQSGLHYNDLDIDCYIKAKPNETSEPQIFHLYKNSLPINGVVTYYGEHIRYQLNGIPVSTGTVGGNVAGILNMLKDRTLLPCSFDFWSDSKGGGSYNIEKPTSLGQILAGSEGSILDRFGGEYEFDNYEVKLHSQRGQDAGVTIKYGKNLSAFTATNDLTNSYTHVLPYATKDSETVIGDIIKLDNADKFVYYKCFTLDLSNKYSTNSTITKENLAEKAQSYIKSANLDTISASYKVSFVQLWQTEEYKNVAALQRCALCDTVTVEHSGHGISVKVKVVKTVYDTLAERYSSMELGTTSANFCRSVTEKIAESAQQTTSDYERAVEDITKKITGNTGGCIVLKLGTSGKPEELLSLNTDDINTATRVWRWNNAGLGYSSTGYNGKYGLAMTSDGEIVADFITTGTLNASLLKTGTIMSTDGKTTIGINDGVIQTTGETAGTTTRLKISSGNIVIGTIKNGKFTEVGKLGFYDNNGTEKSYLLVEEITASGSISTNVINVGEVLLDGVLIKKKSESDRNSVYSNAYTSPTFRLSNDSHSNIGAFYISSNDKAVLETDAIYLDGNYLSKKTTTINGTTINYIGW